MADLYTFPNQTSGLDAIVIGVIDSVPSLIPLLLVFVYFLVFLGGVGQQKARTGTADYPIWSVIASIAVFMITLILSVSAGFINLDWLVIVIGVTILSGVWLFLDRKQSEV